MHTKVSVLFDNGRVYTWRVSRANWRTRVDHEMHIIFTDLAGTDVAIDLLKVSCLETLDFEPPLTKEERDM